MARTTVHVCSECGFQTAKWHGQCQGCEAWNTLVEERVAPKSASGRSVGGAGARGATRGASGTAGGPIVAPRPLHEVGASAIERMSTGIGELDRVLGGGLVPGSLVLLGGSPGIGKSTLTNMVLGHLHAGGHKTLLQVPILAETDLDTVLETLEHEAPDACVIDSVQTLGAAELSGAPGPRVLEHLVDCVLQFEGERERPYRELRALKNRFGSTNESGLFEMRQGGLVEVLDASARFVAEATRAPGSVVLAAMEGSRPLLVEVQALVAPSELEQPRRVVSGLDRNRLALVLAILGRHGHVRTGGADVFVNVVGGVRVDEPGCDLAVALAIASASRGVPLKGSPRACFGELGLTGELRWVGHPERRLEEAAKHGLSGVIAPVDSGRGACEVSTLRDALTLALGSGPGDGRGRPPAKRPSSPIGLVSAIERPSLALAGDEVGSIE